MTTTLDLRELEERLPAGYGARPFEESDREPLVALRNAELHPVQHSTAEEWRFWEAKFRDETQVRVVVAAPDGTVVGGSHIGTGGPSPYPDGAASIGAQVAPDHRRRGIGSALLDFLEAEARRRSAPRALGGANESIPGALEWAQRRGYREIGRRIDAYIELAGFDPSRFRSEVERVRAGGIRFVTMAEALAGKDEDAREALFRELYEAQRPMYEDVPFPSPRPYWPYEAFRRVADNPRSPKELTVLAFDGDRVAGITATGLSGRRNAVTGFTGVGREHRRRGIAFALKVDVLARAKASGIAAMLTTNDEPNKPMRGINLRLGYMPLPATVSLEKRLT